MKFAQILAVACFLCGCAQPAVPNLPGRGVLPALTFAAAGASAKVHHVVLIVQENRSVDNLFHGVRGVDTVNSGKNSLGQTVALAPISMTATFDISHEHSAYLTERANGELNGFNLVSSTCRRGFKCVPRDVRAYGYVPHSQIGPYLQMAQDYAFADHMFETNQGPSFPAHQYLISGTSTVSDGSDLRAASNGYVPDGGFTGGCDSPPGTFVLLIDAVGNEDQSMFPCFDRLTLMDLIDHKLLSWRYYQQRPGGGLWNAPDAIRGIRYSKEYPTHVISPPTSVLSDISHGLLADVVWVTPTAKASDHPGTNNGTGPSWVASIVNAIGKSSYWNDTAIFVVWDDWGGWYDHVEPQQYNSYELGFRVPLIVISPYAKAHYVSHTQYEFGSILKFIEETFDLGSLKTTDMRANDLSGCFDFNQSPRQFVPIRAPRSKEYFLKQPDSSGPIDY